VRRRRDSHRDPTADHLSLGEHGALLESMDPRRRQVLVGYFLHDLPIPEIMRQTGMTRTEVDYALRSVSSVLRHPVRWRQLAPDRSEELRRFADQQAFEYLRPCGWCNRRVLGPVTRQGGRPAVYCSGSCRQAAYRARKRMPSVPPGEVSSG
jgi:hypothetical protein